MSVRIDVVRARAIVTFPHDPDAVELIKTIPSKRWRRDRRHWTIDGADVPLAAKRFAEAGHDVLVDGKRYTTSVSSSSRSSTASATDPLGALLQLAKPALRQPICKALARVLHPDAGGDTELMQQLNNAWRDHQ